MQYIVGKSKEICPVQYYIATTMLAWMPRLNDIKNPSSYWLMHALFIKHYNTCEQSSLERLILFYNNQTLQVL